MSVRTRDQDVVLMFTSRVEQPRVVHRFLPRTVESESCGAMDATTGKATPIHHGKEVHEAFVGKSILGDPFVSCTSLTVPVAIRTTSRFSALPSAPDRACRSQATIRWTDSLTAKGDSGVPGCCFLHPTLGATPSLHDPSDGPGEHFGRHEPLQK